MKPRILIDPSSHHLLNLGDVAMLQVCVERLRELWPAAGIGVVTDAPELLERHCLDVQAVPATGRYDLLGPPEPRVIRRAPATLMRPLLRIERARRGRGSPALKAYLDALLDADLFVMSGRGGMTDAFKDESYATLDEIHVASALSVPVALLGQGMGPIADPDLRRLAARVLPRAALITLREGRSGPGLLRELGVPARKVVVTGDDAIALAPQAPPAEPDAVGVSVRVAGYAQVSADAATELLDALATVASRLAAPVVQLPMSVHPHEGDHESMRGVLGATSEPPGSPAAAVERTGRCRVLATGSYHAGLFALAQGVPAVCFSRSPYYDDKFLGLREMFGDGCAVVRAADSGAPSRVAELVERAYRSWPEPAAGLRAAARRQEEAGRTAYARLPALVDP